jgi:hypothetical protein
MTRDEDPGATTIIAKRLSRCEAIIGTIVGGSLVALAPSTRSPDLVKHVPVPDVAAYLAVVAAASIWGCARALRMALRVDDLGVTVRNYFRTCRFAWHEVSSFADGAVPGDQGSTNWALSVVPHGRRAVTVWATSRAAPDPEMLTAIRQAAVRHGVPADLTGDAAQRSFRLFWLAVAAFAFLLSWLFGVSSS